jgi:exonuclease SbcC
MKLLKLKVAGFGPFREEQFIDFERCNAEGLFSVAGPTGSGKTSLLDAISFALYGETTGEGQGRGESNGRIASDVRCTACTPQDPTMVELDFEVDGQRFLARRNPRYERAAKRGDGLTMQEASAEIFEATAEGHVPVDGQRTITQVNSFIERKIGLSADQFRRVVVIPQGRFREVLLSPPEQRQELLKRIFGTHLYEQFTELVKSRTTAHRKTLDDIRIQAETLTRGLAWAEGLGVAVARDKAKTLHADADRRYVESDAEARRCAEMHKAAATALDNATSANALLDSVERAQKVWNQAQVAMTALAPQRRELEDARRVELAARAIEERGSARRQLDIARDGQEVARKAVAPLRDAQVLAEQAKDMAETTGSAEAERLSNEQGSIRVELSMLRTKQEQITKARDERMLLEKKLADEKGAHGVAQSAREAAKLAHDRIQRQLAEARNAQRSHRAGLLARDLSQNTPCPVCGSTSHPSPAVLADDAISDSAIERLESEERRAHQELNERSQSEFNAARAVTATEDKITSATSNARAGNDEQDVSAEINRRQCRLAAIQERMDWITEWRTRTADDARSAREAYQDALGVLEVANTEVAGASALFASAETRVRSALDAVPGQSAEDVKRATRPADWISATEDKLAKAQEELNRADGALEEAKSQAGTALRRDLAPFAADVETWDSKGQAAERDAKSAMIEAVEAKKLADSLDDLATRTTKSETAFRPAHELLQVIVGATAEARISLHNWVLGAFLDEVLAVASHRMLDMTKGRYELRRMAGQLDGRQEAGLNIEVFDSHAGTCRPARTLSGGETFLASLSMALALAEVAGARGGRALDTVFIDEGFGSLDSDTLDVAMSVLERLRDAGRTVGLISHVEEMKRRIQTGIEVVKDPATGTSRVLQPA